MELYKSVLLCVLAIVLLADLFAATPIRSHHSKNLRSNHFRVEQELDEAFSVLDAENAFNSRMQRNRTFNRRRRSFPNESVIAIRHCFNQLLRARRRNPPTQISSRCERILRPYSRTRGRGSDATVIIIEK
ncbi:uncharacterized protein LOC132557545 [Ylistrum balloti]|uniref:uncharacterized protein LOC132557545 n=1 Tax=Ylistrum balloti TaxID=509963 RepID=UPI002905B2BB|nr:uncharacterized protein LOC132557545 [Ylistrum balloti]